MVISDSLQTFEDSERYLAPDERTRLQLASPAEIRKLRIFTEQWTRVQVPLRAYLASFLGNSIAVDDGVQEVALVVWNKGPWEVEPPAFLGYTLACARRVALASRRRQNDGRMKFLSPEVASALADTVAVQEQQEANWTAERFDALRTCLKGLPASQRELLEARYSAKSAAELSSHAERTGAKMDCLYKKLERLREILRICVNRRQAQQQ